MPAARLRRFLLLSITCLAVALISAPGMAAAETYVPPLAVEHSCPSAVVIDASRGRLLYAKEHEKKQDIPASSKMMTAGLACERLPLQTQVTISKVAELADASFASPDGIRLLSGSKYPLEYLLLRLIYYNSDAAALAIAEQLSGVEERFVELMNSRAKSLSLTSTVYANCTGAVAYLSQPAGNSQGLLPVEQSLRQYTTPLDLARLLAAAVQNKLFSQLMSQSSQYVVLDGNTLVAMSNDLWRIWTLSEGRVSGAFSSPLAGRSYLVAIGKLSSLPLVVVAAAGQPDRRLQDLLALVDACNEYYEVAPLVQAGDTFSGERERTQDGEEFGLVYKTTVQYIHPVGDYFLKQDLRYRSYGPFKRPIQTSMTAGQVLFELLDGTVIAVDVAPDRQILSRISLIDSVLGELQKNRNLTLVILAAASLLLLSLMLQAVRQGRRLAGRIVLLLWEKRSRG